MNRFIDFKTASLLLNLILVHALISGTTANRISTQDMIELLSDDKQTDPLFLRIQFFDKWPSSLYFLVGYIFTLFAFAIGKLMNNIMEKDGNFFQRLLQSPVEFSKMSTKEKDSVIAYSVHAIYGALFTVPYGYAIYIIETNEMFDSRTSHYYTVCSLSLMGLYIWELCYRRQVSLEIFIHHIITAFLFVYFMDKGFESFATSAVKIGSYLIFGAFIETPIYISLVASRFQSPIASKLLKFSSVYTFFSKGFFALSGFFVIPTLPSSFDRTFQFIALSILLYIQIDVCFLLWKLGNKARNFTKNRITMSGEKKKLLLLKS
ncbi:hypothetical protein BKA69DRAFT_556658 [Paraphysoderma sedebokerense]|nr:hypothetical protein BKA69DRAFT_556658 [Paraphysoderma sedebokerense]